MLGLGRLCWVGRSGSTQWNNPTNLTDPTGFVVGDENGGSTVFADGKKKEKEEETCDKRCQQLEKILQNTVCRLFGCHSNENGLPKGKDDSGGKGQNAPATISGGEVQILTKADIYQSWAAGAGNKAANLLVGAANLLIAMSPSDAELIEPVKPFTPKNEYIASKGGAVVDGLSGLGGAGGAGRLAAGGKTEVVYRWMSKAELEATRKTNLLRGGREGTHYVTDAANSNPLNARMRSALPQTPEVRVKMEVPAGAFSSPSKVQPAFNMPGGGMERTATGQIPVRILEVK